MISTDLDTTSLHYFVFCLHRMNYSDITRRASNLRLCVLVCHTIAPENSQTVLYVHQLCHTVDTYVFSHAVIDILASPTDLSVTRSLEMIGIDFAKKS